MSKKFLSILLALVMVLTIAPVVTFAEEDITSYLTYEIINGEVIITGCDSSISGDVVIPATIEGYPVTEIANWAFCECSNISGITISKNVASIYKWSFDGCSMLENIVVDEENANYSSDEYGVLFNKNKTELILYPKANSRTEYTIPDSVTSICDEAFYCCKSLESITIPNSVTTIGDEAFYGCESLASITLPDSVTVLGDQLFTCCFKLAEIIVDENNINYSSDEYGVLFNKNKSELLCYPSGSNRAEYTIPDGVEIIGDYLFENNENLISVKIPDSVTTIGIRAFEGCYNLENINIPEGVVYIGERAFFFCGFTDVTIPASVEVIGEQAFFFCPDLEKITVDEENEYYSSDEYGILFNKDKTELIQSPEGITDYTIPQSVKIIGKGAFFGCQELKNITIPDGVTTISEDAFQQSGITNIEIPASVTYIGNSAFFSSALESITLPDNQISIGSSIINYTPYYEDESNWDNGVLYLGNHLLSAKEDITECEIKDGTLTIAGNAFEWCYELSSIIIPESVMHIGAYAFSNTAYFNEISNWDGDSLYIDNHLIYTNDFGDVIVKDGTLTIADCAICSYISNEENKITIPESVKYIGEQYGEIYGGTYIIVGDRGSYAETYANEKGWTFVEMCHHETTVLKDAVDVTCTANGYTGDVYCEVCDELLTMGEVITATEHAEEIIPGRDATCTEQGLTEGVKCSVCGEILVEQTETSVLIHTMEVIPGKDATCAETGLTEGMKCSVCGEIIFEQEIIEKTGHMGILIIPGIEATCTEPGFTSYAECSVCGFLEESTVIPATGHVAMPTLGGYTPTCVDTTVQKSDLCCNCGERFNERTEIIPGTGHTEEVIPEVPATYKATGLTEGKKCSVCGEILVEQTVIPMLVNPNLTTESSDITVTDKLANLVPEMSVEYIIKSVENEKVVILSKDGAELEKDALVGTGSKVQVLDNDGIVLSEYEVMVQSDVDGNGKITPADARLALRASAGLDIIQGVYETAANYDGQDTISTSDARMILRKAAGLE